MRTSILGFFGYTLLYLEFMIWDVTSLKGEKVEYVKDSEFPFIVSISSKLPHMKPAQQHMCGGTLYTKRHVLTAAHCIRDKKTTDMRVITGLSSKNQANLMFFDVIHSEVYEDWAKKYGFVESLLDDIGVLHLDVEDSGITPAILQILPKSHSPGSTAVLTGWAQKSDDLSYLAMKKSPLTTLNNLDCQNHMNRFSSDWEKIEIPDQYICTQGTPAGLGECGDSGSPLLDENDFVIGVHISICQLTRNSDAARINIALDVFHYQGFIADVSFENDV